MSNNFQKNEHSKQQLAKVLTLEMRKTSASNKEKPEVKKVLDYKPFISFAKRNAAKISTPKMKDTMMKQRTSNVLRIQEGMAKYNIGTTIGKGAYAVVKLGVHIETGRKVAIKIYDKSSFTDAKRKACLDREVKIMQRLSHPNIVRLYDTVDTSRQLCLIMQLVKGQSLCSYVRARRGRKLVEAECMRVFAQVTAGIEYCHKRGVVHRDIKMENILLDANYNVVIIDFGFSICAGANQKLRMFCGTPSYMTPEIVMKKEYSGPPADVWSLGILLYAMLCGQFPFRGVTEPELFKCIARCHFTFPPGVSVDARNLVTSMLQLKPEKRATIEKVHKESCKLARLPIAEVKTESQVIKDVIRDNLV
eukprot:TRINITY_DN1363_c0_g2_i2.p1 TRINITY_DN1363_c0_g2~~TRINITY_DN1363_c0_g2_i2.p1  ORF type:complete len:363 (+),score=96.00 TRINITY_DN1363_c0_g2_i2:341-1429(+)